MECRLLHTKLVELAAYAALMAKKDREICGLLIDNGFCFDMLVVPNKSKSIGSFAFDETAVKRIKRAVQLTGNEIIGTFHSHPWSPAKPSKSDIENTLDDSLMMIISVSDQSAKLWYIKNGMASSIQYRTLRARKDKGWYRKVGARS